MNCGCEYPEFAQPEEKERKTTGLRTTMRYSGKYEHMKGLVGYITYKAHPSPGVTYPLLEVECPSCGELAISQNAQTNPAAESVRYKKTAAAIKIASQSIYCQKGHAIRLKVDRMGRYTWD